VYFSSLFSHAFDINFQDGIKSKKKSAISLHHQKKKTDCFCKAAAYKTIMINQMRSIEAKNYNEYWVGGRRGLMRELLQSAQRNVQGILYYYARNVIG
jgi:hypothetical protein